MNKNKLSVNDIVADVFYRPITVPSPGVKFGDDYSEILVAGTIEAHLAEISAIKDALSDYGIDIESTKSVHERVSVLYVAGFDKIISIDGKDVLSIESAYDYNLTGDTMHASVKTIFKRLDK